MKKILFAGVLTLPLAACANPPAFFADPTSVYVQQPTPLPDVSSLQSVSNVNVHSPTSLGGHPFNDYRRRGVVEPADWRSLNAEQIEEATH